MEGMKQSVIWNKALRPVALDACVWLGVGRWSSIVENISETSQWWFRNHSEGTRRYTGHRNVSIHGAPRMQGKSYGEDCNADLLPFQNLKHLNFGECLFSFKNEHAETLRRRPESGQSWGLPTSRSKWRDLTEVHGNLGRWTSVVQTPSVGQVDGDRTAMFGRKSQEKVAPTSPPVRFTVIFVLPWIFR